ncbi:MAG: FAD-dependent oxidoreductase [Oscillospiraceae bacterium]|nr:FAD-dependent oxidoreductase [Oscillospiraceae bacterium]
MNVMSAKVFKIKINGQEFSAESGKSILQVASENGIEIPSLCHDERLKMYGSCGICTVEIAGNHRLIRACSTLISDGMEVVTESERIAKNRRFVLELLLSDHKGDCKAPCTSACPAETDCRSYVNAISDGDYEAAVNTVREKIPFPASIGRVCPRPCEDACRRELVEEPVQIAALKQFVGDESLNQNLQPVFKPQTATGKSVGIIGGGPAGLSAAYYLRLQGHAVTIYEAMPKLGGMLRYGIPEYRLPKAVLQKEIDLIENTGVVFKTGVKVALDDVCTHNDVTIIAIGAWNSTGLRCKGEELSGVIAGIDFLCEPSAFELSGKVVSIVGGGNTAMDACRTAVRMGAKKVYCVYRRTRDEMPAQDIEISEAMEEGVEFKFLTNPIEIVGNEKVQSMRLRIMELGDSDESGRRKPIETDKEESISVDMVISAIGQKPKFGVGEADEFAAIKKTKWGTIVANTLTFQTNVDRVYAIGDATNNGADIAVTAIGEAGRCAKVVDTLLKGGTPEKSLELVQDTKIAEDFANVPKQSRSKIVYRNPSVRAKDWREVYTLFGEEDAKKEASRCLKCGCDAYRGRDCRLIWYANLYGAVSGAKKYEGFINKHHIPVEDHDKIARNPEKCVLCGLCVRVCEEVEQLSVLGFYGRGFDTSVKPALGRNLKDTDCNSCGKCVEICPTGAMSMKELTNKE